MPLLSNSWWNMDSCIHLWIPRLYREPDECLQGTSEWLEIWNTLVEVIDAITHGMLMWQCSLTNPQVQVHALTVGSLCGPQVPLTTAFTDQFHSIGWQYFVMGWLSHHWGAAVAMFRKATTDINIQMRWRAQAIAFLWRYLRSEWAYRIQLSMDQMLMKWLL